MPSGTANGPCYTGTLPDHPRTPSPGRGRPARAWGHGGLKVSATVQGRRRRTPDGARRESASFRRRAAAASARAGTARAGTPASAPTTAMSPRPYSVSSPPLPPLAGAAAASYGLAAGRLDPGTPHSGPHCLGRGRAAARPRERRRLEPSDARAAGRAHASPARAKVGFCRREPIHVVSAINVVSAS